MHASYPVASFARHCSVLSADSLYGRCTLTGAAHSVESRSTPIVHAHTHVGATMQQRYKRAVVSGCCTVLQRRVALRICGVYVYVIATHHLVSCFMPQYVVQWKHLLPVWPCLAMYFHIYACVGEQLHCKSLVISSGGQAKGWVGSQVKQVHRSADNKKWRNQLMFSILGFSKIYYQTQSRC